MVRKVLGTIYCIGWFRIYHIIILITLKYAEGKSGQELSYGLHLIEDYSEMYEGSMQTVHLCNRNG